MFATSNAISKRATNIRVYIFKMFGFEFTIRSFCKMLLAFVISHLVAFYIPRMQIIILWCEGNGKQDVFLVMFLVFRIHTSVETDKRIRKFLINMQHLAAFLLSWGSSVCVFCYVCKQNQLVLQIFPAQNLVLTVDEDLK